MASHEVVLQKLLVVLKPNLTATSSLTGGVQNHESCEAFPGGVVLDLMDGEGDRDHIGSKAHPISGFGLIGDLQASMFMVLDYADVARLVTLFGWLKGRGAVGTRRAFGSSLGSLAALVHWALTIGSPVSQGSTR